MMPMVLLKSGSLGRQESLGLTGGLLLQPVRPKFIYSCDALRQVIQLRLGRLADNCGTKHGTMKMGRANQL